MENMDKGLTVLEMVLIVAFAFICEYGTKIKVPSEILPLLMSNIQKNSFKWLYQRKKISWLELPLFRAKY